MGMWTQAKAGDSSQSNFFFNSDQEASDLDFVNGRIEGEAFPVLQTLRIIINKTKEENSVQIKSGHVHEAVSLREIARQGQDDLRHRRWRQRRSHAPHRAPPGHPSGPRRNRPRLPHPLRPLPPPPALPQAAPLPLPVSSSTSDLPSIARSLSRSVLGSAPAYVSSCASSITKSNDSPYFVGSEKCLEDSYHPVNNPDGVIQMGLAENHLSLVLIGEWLANNYSNTLLDQRQCGLSIRRLAAYQPFDGLVELKTAVAGFVGQLMQGRVLFDPSRIILTAGATSAMEILSFCLADPGNAFLVPSPYYPGYDRNIRWRTGIKLIPVPCRSTDNFGLRIAALERAYNHAKQRGVKVRADLLSNPSNSVGNLLNRETQQNILDFATEKNIHVIVDEVFAGSIYGNEEFVSMAEVLDAEEFDRSRVHIIYSLSKDLSVPGFRTGLIYSFNDQVLAAASRLARFSSVSVPTQHLLTSMLTDSSFTRKYIKTNKMRLQEMHSTFVDGLKQVGIDCVKSSGGFYCWADMSKFMKSYSEKGEFELWKEMLSLAKLNLTPGTACHCIEPGWFRLCFTTLTVNDIPVVIERIKRVVNTQLNLLN